MKLNLYREIQYEPSDYFTLFKQQIDNQSYISFFPNYDTTHGVKIEKELPKNGIYLIYKIVNEEYVLLYIGCSDYSIQQRICRYVAAARGTQRFDENHAGGEKHRKVFGENLTNMFVKFIDIDYNTLVDVTMKDMENYLIEVLEPIFNNENYWKYSFEPKLEIVKCVA